MSKILFVSDDETKKNIISKALAKSTNALLSTTDEQAVINYVEKGQIDMIIVDEDTKEPDVLILCKKLHSAAIKANVAILAVVNQNTDNTEMVFLERESLFQRS